MNKSTFLITVAICLLICTLSSCSKIHNGSEGEGTLYLSIKKEAESKTTVSQTQIEDNTVNTIDVFVFRSTYGTDNGVLDAYRRFSGNDLGNLTNLEVTATTGEKEIYVIANSHIDDYTGIMNISDYRNIISSLNKEFISSFTMTGHIKTTLGLTTNIGVSLKRLVSRIGITGIKTSFANTPYAGQSITDVKIYLINVKGDKILYSGNATPQQKTLNLSQAVAEDINSCTQTGLLYDEITPSISDAGYTQSHYFFCYENSIESESDSEKFTRLVIEGVLNGKKYYYPININQQGYGYIESNGHHGIMRNTVYTISVTIFRPGSTDPDKPLTLGSVKTNISIENWNTTPTSNINF